MIEIPAVNIGSVLKGQREKLGHSLQDVAQNTRIRKTYLESIENNQFDDLPGQTYVIGFIRVYAHSLGLDSNVLLSQLDQTWTGSDVPALKILPASGNQPRHYSKSGSGAGRVTLAAGLLVLLALGVGIYLLSPEFFGRETIDLPGEKIATEQKSVQGQNEETAKSLMPKESTASLQQEINTAAVVIEIAPAEGHSLPVIPQGGSSLRILALAQSSLIIYIDDRESHHYELQNGLDMTWKINKKVKIELSAPGVARFWLGSEELKLDEKTSFLLQQGKDLSAIP